MSEEPTPPEPPADLPAYVTDPLQKQSPERLRQVQSYIDDLLAHRERLAERDLDEEGLADDGEEIVDVEQQDSGPARVVKKTTCGKENCSTCPHGPYLYLVHSDGSGGQTWEYKGPVSE